MTDPAIKPRVFVSSVVTGYEAYREAARAAVISAGGEPVLVNEDFPALSGSPRNVCLDAVTSSDIYMLLLGAKGGSKAPSSKLIVEEEYEEARKHGIPVLLLLQDIERDSTASLLEKKISDYVHGGFRRKYSSERELQEVAMNALVPLIKQMSIPLISPDLLQQALSDSPRTGHETTVTLAIAPSRAGEVIDPVALESPQFLENVYQIAHAPSVKLLSYAKSKQQSIQRGILIIQQTGEGHPRDEIRLTLAENGMITASANVTGRRERGREFDLGLIIDANDIQQRLHSAFSFVSSFYDQYDPYKRHQGFLYAVSLANVGHRRIERDTSPRQSYPVGYNSRELVFAFDKPRNIDRTAIMNSDAEIDRVLTLLQRQINAN